jgi:hypothetical protein
VETALRRGYLFEGEELRDGDVYNAYSEETETPGERRTRLLQLIDHLYGLVTRLEGGPVAADWFEENIEYEEPGGHVTVGSSSDFLKFYDHYAFEQGLDGRAIFLNWTALQSRVIPQARVASTRIDDRSLQLGRWLVVPDPEREPQRWYWLSGFEPIRGEIVELSSDHRGYFYFWRGRRIYLPDFESGR